MKRACERSGTSDGPAASAHRFRLDAGTLARWLSPSDTLKISSTMRARSFGSSTGNMTSTPSLEVAIHQSADDTYPAFHPTRVINPTVLQERSTIGSRCSRSARNARSQTADAAHDQVDLHRLARARHSAFITSRSDGAFIFAMIRAGTRPCVLRFPPDVFQDPLHADPAARRPSDASAAAAVAVSMLNSALASMPNSSRQVKRQIGINLRRLSWFPVDK